MNKKLKVLSSTALAATLVVPVAAPAFAASTTTLSGNPVSVNTDSKFSARININVNGGSFTSDDSFTLRLPVDSQGKIKDVKVYYDDTNDVTSAVFPSASDKPANGTTGREFKFNLDGDGIVTGSTTLKNSQKAVKIVVDLEDVTVPPGASGNIDAEIEAAPGSAISSNKITIATVGNGAVSASIDDVKAITASSTEISTLRFKEDRPGSLALTTKAIKLKLPTGYKWDYSNGDITSSVTVKNLWNTNETGYKVRKDDDRTIYLDASGLSKSSDARYVTIEKLKVVADDTDAKTGDVELSISGDSSISNSTLVIGKYGNFTGSVSAATPKNVYAGATGSKVADLIIKEDSPGTLLEKRVLKLTLSGNAKWKRDKETGLPVGPRIKAADSKLYNLAFNNNLEWTWSGSDYTTIQATVQTASKDKAATLVLEKGEIDVAPTANGDVKVIVGGTAGISGEAVVAKAQSPVTVTVADKKDVVIGTQEQEISDIVIKEVESENIDKGKLVLEFPEGVRPSLPSSVEVDGDIKIDKAGITRDGRTLSIPVTGTSSKASTVTVKGLKLIVDRTVPEGDVKVKIKGDSVFAGYSIKDGSGYVTYNPFSTSEYVAEGVVANVTTPGAGKGTAATAVFKLNSKTFTVNGKSVEMDVQPLVKWDRAYVPVRFAANALGVADENILWDDKTQTVTISKDGKIVQMTVGKKEYTVNGVKVPMDAPVLRNKAETNNRTMLPLRYIANALNVPVDWNKETSEITLGEVK